MARPNDHLLENWSYPELPQDMGDHGPVLNCYYSTLNFGPRPSKLGGTVQPPKNDPHLQRTWCRLELRKKARRHFAPRTFCPTDKMPQDKMPQGHFAPGHFAPNRTKFWKVDILPQL